MPKQLSGGQRQRVAMGRAIVREPSVFLFDEPLSNLDANLRNQMRIELRRLHQRLATTSIYVTHDQVEAMTLAEKILVLRAGNIEQYGTPDDIYLHPASVFVAQFMGSPSMNMIPATTDGEKLILPDGTPLSGVAASDIRLAAAPSKDVLVGLRCEDLLLDPEGSVQVTVDIIEALGPDTLAYCHPITGKAAAAFPIRAPSSCVFPARAAPRPATPSASPSAPATATSSIPPAVCAVCRREKIGEGRGGPGEKPFFRKIFPPVPFSSQTAISCKTQRQGRVA